MEVFHHYPFPLLRFVEGNDNGLYILACGKGTMPISMLLDHEILVMQFIVKPLENYFL